MEKEVLKVRQDIYAPLFRIHKQEVYSSYVLLPTKAMPDVSYRGNNSTSRPFLPLFYYFFRFLRLPVLYNKKYQPQFLPNVFRDMPCSPVPENFCFFNMFVTVSLSIPKTRPVSLVPEPFVTIAMTFSSIPGSHALY